MTGNFDYSLTPGVSVVVCCFNSSEVIEPTIDALATQEVPAGAGYEVILVDNNCTDDTVGKAIKAWQHPRYPLQVVEESKPGLIHARKTGVNKAQYDILLFVDDDNILNPGWVKKLYDLYQKRPRVGAIGGYNKILCKGKIPDWFDACQSVYACGPRDLTNRLNPKKLFGAGLSFRTPVVRAVLFSNLPLFLIGKTRHTLTRGEDTEMALRCRLMGWDFYYDDSLGLLHHLQGKKLTWKYVCQARKRGGMAGIILRIYRFLLEGREPQNLSTIRQYVWKQWKNYFREYKKSFFHIKKPGSETSFKFYRLLGMSLGLCYYRKTYPHIRQRIIEHYGYTGKS